MKCAMFVYGVFAFFAAGYGNAAEPTADAQADAPAKAAAEKAVEVTEPVVPKRELTFEESGEEYPMPFTAADAELVNQRYVAVFRSIGFSQSRPPYILSHSVDRNLRSLHSMALHAGGLVFSEDPASYPELLRALVRDTPQNLRPSEDTVSALTTSGCRVVRLDRGGPSNPDDPNTSLECHEFKILAPTAERAKELTEGLLVLYDYGLSCPVQREYLRLKEAAEKQLPQDRAAAEKAKQELAGCERELEKLKEFEDIGPEALVDFKAQLRMVSVDLAGIKARIDACNKLLARRVELGASRIEQVETVKITAEIELVGVAARRVAIENLVKTGQRRLELVDQVKKHKDQVRRLEAAVASWPERIAEYEAARKQYMPFPIQDGKVMIHRIKWVATRGF